ncbi:MAG: hypothetical protein A2Z20_01895 [Bdellovibrionales bacterium RBG_16_40_8]|nr:MAG: hypothetical protein A2Z20_01895 [Bdellovibrionales bacterium RBG_16_40_8]
MDFEAELEMFTAAERHFIENRYSDAEPTLNQLVLKNTRRPEVYHMLGTVYYDQGKFNKAIRSFRRALEIDSGFTDSSVGLSIILNDLGRYEEGKAVFDAARAGLDIKNKTTDPTLNEKFAAKHDELGGLYFNHHRYNEALEQFQKALKLTSSRRPEISLNIANCYEKLEDFTLAQRELTLISREYPHYVPARLKLGKYYHDNKQIPEAIEQWESVLENDPLNVIARDYLRLVQAIHVTNLNPPRIEL